jgi:hypothetical protein
MVSFSLLGLLLFRGGSRGVRATVAFALATLVKYLSGPAILWLAVASAARVANWWARARRLVLIGCLAVGIAVGLALPWLELPDSLDPLLNETAGVGYVNALPDHLALGAAERVTVVFGSPEAETRELARVVERVLGLAMFGLVLALETRGVWRDPSPRSIVHATAASSLAVILVVSSSLQPWYFALPLALSVLLGWRDRLTRVVVGYSVLGLPTLYLAYYLREGTPEVVWLVCALVPLLPLLGSLPARGRFKKLAAASASARTPRGAWTTGRLPLD